jgi:hypothetical protein
VIFFCRVLREVSKVDKFYRAMESHLDHGFRALESEIKFLLSAPDKQVLKDAKENLRTLLVHTYKRVMISCSSLLMSHI